MANNTLNTRIVLCNDTSINWGNSSKVLLKGEMAIEFPESGSPKIKFGNGTDTFADLPYAIMTPSEINDAISAAITSASHTHNNKNVLDATTASFTSALLSKLNGIASGAEVNQNTFSNFKVGDTTISADEKTDTITFVGSNVTITPDEANDKITIGVANGTTSAKGVVQLTNSTSSTSTTTAATPNSVKTAYDLANTAKTTADTARSTADSKIGSVNLTSGTNNGTLKLTVDGIATDNIAVKGLGSAAYTASSSYATSTQGTKADNAMPKSGGTFTGGVTLNADPTSALHPATKQYVDTQIASKIAASDAMVFKGTLGTNGTITAIPTTGVVKGDTYKIITDGTYAGSSCKIGDLLIALNSGSIEATTNNWAYIPSGNESTTSIKYSTTTQNLTTSAKTGSITLAEGATKQVDSSIESGTSSTKLPTSTAVASFVDAQIGVVNSAIDTHKNDSTLHITADERTKWNKAQANQNAFSNVKVGDTTVAADAATDTLTLEAGSNITITPDATNDKITITAKDTTYGAAGSSLGLVKSGGDVAIKDGVITINDDSHYHVISNVDGLQATLDAKSVNKVLTSENLNDVKTPGFYNAGEGNTVTNKPSDVDNFGLEVIHNATGLYYTQILYTDSGSCRRVCTSGTWGNWTQDKLTDTNTHYTTSIYAGASGTAENTAITSPYIKIVDNTTYRNQIRLLGSGSVSVTSDGSGNITIKGTDNNTDTKVTNTLATTTKAYITGTTSKNTNTGTQVFDTGVYLDTTAGQLVATTFKGSLSGNASTATKATSADSATTATKLNSSAGSTTQPVYFTGGKPVACNVSTDYFAQGTNTLILNGGGA